MPSRLLRGWSCATLLALLALAAPVADAQVDVEATVRGAESLAAQGELNRARALLEPALAGLAETAPAADRALLSSSLGQVLSAAGETERAVPLLEAAVALAGEADDQGLRATALNGLGNAMLRDDPVGALANYDASARLAVGWGRTELAQRAAINGVRAALRKGDTADAAGRLARAERGVPTSDTLARLALAGLAVDLASADRRHLELAHRTTSAALAAAGDGARDRSWAEGYRGDLYALAGRPEEALALLRSAALLADRARAPEVLFRWQWRSGRLLAGLGRREEAIAAYRSSVRSLEQVRAELPAFDARTGRSLFRETLGPVFVELADLLLLRARERGEAAGQADLAEARLTVERLKTVELADYFGDDCTAALRAQVRPIDQPGTRTAVLYPVPLADRTELILSLPDGRLASARSAIGAAALGQQATQLRTELENPFSEGFLAPAQRLYDELIRPMQPLLDGQGVETLVFVPDGALRNIPVAALHDGRQFVVERYAVATGIGLSLLDTRPLQSRPVNVLIGGLTQSVSGFSALPGVGDEIAAITPILGSTTRFVDERFTTGAVQQSLARAPFNVVHLASHGEFTGDPKNSFILTWDGRLDMDELERLIKFSQFRDEPVDLLTLSACKTAAGDDRSALGLAGLAIKVGARSAMGSLWSIADESTPLLIAEFYKNVLQPEISKAEALRRAQRTLVDDPSYSHPYYWAPFLLIGNWT